ncbi:hypothetical protein Dimus_032092 [Dionaea muscipula]
MASKSKIRPPPLNTSPVAASSSSDEDKQQPQAPTHGRNQKPQPASSSDDEGTSSEEQEENQQLQESRHGKNQNPQPAGLNDKRSDSDSIFVHDSDSSRLVKSTRVGTSDLARKPVTSKSMSYMSATPSKRPRREETEVKSVKLSKPRNDKNIKEESSFRKTPWIWGESDEIVLLQGVISFEKKNDKRYNANVANFHEFMKGKLSLCPDSKLLVKKLGRLKKKFMKIKIWDSDSAADGNHNSRHVVIDEYAKKISTRDAKKSGGKSVANGSSVVANDAVMVADPLEVKVGKVVYAIRDETRLIEMYPNLARALKSHEHRLGSKLVWETVWVLSESELKMLDDSWKQRNIAELELVMKRIELMNEEASLMRSNADLLKELTIKILNVLKLPKEDSVSHFLPLSECPMVVARIEYHEECKESWTKIFAGVGRFKWIGSVTSMYFVKIVVDMPNFEALDGIEMSLSSSTEKTEEVKYVVPLLDMDINKLVLAYPWRQQQKIYLQCVLNTDILCRFWGGGAMVPGLDFARVRGEWRVVPVVRELVAGILLAGFPRETGCLVEAYLGRGRGVGNGVVKFYCPEAKRSLKLDVLKVARTMEECQLKLVKLRETLEYCMETHPLDWCL